MGNINQTSFSIKEHKNLLCGPKLVNKTNFKINYSLIKFEEKEINNKNLYKDSHIHKTQRRL